VAARPGPSCCICATRAPMPEEDGMTEPRQAMADDTAGDVPGRCR
jgi:hypothetical protein